MSRQIRSKIEELEKRFRVRTPSNESVPVPIEWLLNYYYGYLSPIEKREILKRINTHETHNNQASRMTQARLDKHKIEVEAEVTRLEWLFKISHLLRVMDNQV